MLIRPEQENEYPKIYDMIKTAFQTARYAEGDEQDFVNRRRNPQEYEPRLSLVIEEADEIIGHIMLTKISLLTETGQYPVLLLAVVSVVLERRNQGIGRKLISAALKQARELDYPAVFVVGDPTYYSRFGFRPSMDFSIKNTNHIEDQYVMALELMPKSLANRSGNLSLPW